MIDPDGYRPNVGIVLMHPDGRVFWARRVHRDGWQFPQGGMNSDETPLEAMYRELREETGLMPEHVEVLGATPGWLRYRLPQRAIRRHDRMVCIGQKQVWFLLRLTGQESDLRLDLTDKPEFDHWRWVDFWYPLEHVEVLDATPGWLRYRLPQRAIRRHDRLVCIGQKQVWFLLRLTGEESDLRLDLTDKPEFDHWRWVDFWYPVEHVVTFKRGVYNSALRHLAPVARTIAGLQAVPVPGPDPRDPRRAVGRRQRPWFRADSQAQGGGSDPSN